MSSVAFHAMWHGTAYIYRPEQARADPNSRLSTAISAKTCETLRLRGSRHTSEGNTSLEPEEYERILKTYAQ